MNTPNRALIRSIARARCLRRARLWLPRRKGRFLRARSILRPLKKVWAKSTSSKRIRWRRAGPRTRGRSYSFDLTAEIRAESFRCKLNRAMIWGVAVGVPRTELPSVAPLAANRPSRRSSMGLRSRRVCLDTAESKRSLAELEDSNFLPASVKDATLSSGELKPRQSREVRKSTLRNRNILVE